MADSVDTPGGSNRERTGSVPRGSALRIGGSQWGADCAAHRGVAGEGYFGERLYVGAPVLIRRVEELDDIAFDLIIRRSFCRHLFDWLTDAARETGYILRAPKCE